MDWTLPEPMLAAAVDSPTLPARHAAEPKWDGFRALLARFADGRVVIRSRRGTDMTAAFGEVTAAVSSLPMDVGLDGELVVWDEVRLAFERLQGRLTRTPGTAARLAERWPVHFVVFDLLYLGTDGDVTGWSHAARRAALVAVFAEYELGGTWTLCPADHPSQLCATAGSVVEEARHHVTASADSSQSRRYATCMTSWSYSNAGDASEPWQIDSIDVTPDPPQHGSTWTVNLRSTIQEEIKEGAYVDITIQMGLIKLLNKRHDLFEELRDGGDGTLTLDPPADNGVISPGEAVLTTVFEIPKTAPKAQFTVQVSGCTAEDESMFTLIFKLDFSERFQR
ncbi:ATP-dependent DNA ligase [Streptomyces hundungensis]|uniref:ATP-dependent DNA ligase n=1 Tax=Streptomyces hundungensis TaxID=1077946 RepID=UPI0033CFC273